jgi:hypothetical protein
MIALLGWPLVTFVMFVTLPGRKALLWSYMLGWLFLPQQTIDLPGIPGLGKLEATALGALAGSVLFDSRTLGRFRFSWVDLPLLVWTFCPIATSLSNGLGLFNGCSSALALVLTYTTPILLGRVYFTNATELRELAKVFVIGAMIYLPFCWFEMRFSPQLHRMVYGVHQHSFAQTIRYGGFRPMVFLQHGLALASFMASSTVLAYWLWRSKSLVRISSIPMQAIVGILGVTTVFCRSGNGVIEMILGALAFTLCRWLPFRVLALAAILLVPGYMVARAGNWITTQQIVDFVSKIDRERAGSLHARLRQEDHFVKHATERVVFGWGGWDRMFPKSEDGTRLTRGVDGSWILVLSKHGTVGLISWLMTLLIGPFVYFWRVPASRWTRPPTAIATSLAVLIVLFMFDNLANAMAQPYYLLTAGALIGTARYRPLSSRSEQPSGSTAARKIYVLPRRLLPGNSGLVPKN